MIVAERYGDALFQLALEGGNEAALFADLTDMATAMETADLSLALSSPMVTFEEKKAVIAALFGGKVCETAENFLLLITEKSRSKIFTEVVKEYKKLYYKKAGITEITAVTAVALTSALTEKLKASLEKKYGKVILENKVDPIVVGGIVLKIGNEQIDASIKSKLDEIEKSLREILV